VNLRGALCDTDRFGGHLKPASLAMWQRWQRGERVRT
jgi:hypothetical protein